MAEEKADLNSLFRDNDRMDASGAERKYCDVGALQLEAGGHLESVTVCFETWGTLNETASNAILVCHALSGDSHCVGWWDRLVGPGKAIDTDRFYVIGNNVLGGCQGTTGPASMASTGKPYGLDFPMVTIGDMVEVQSRLIRALGIEQLYAICGGSMGGMQALEWSVRFPKRVKKIFATASCASHSAMQIGFNETGRQAIMRDPKWNGGFYDPLDPPSAGLAVARMVGHLTFLSEQSFDRKFSRRLQGKDRFDYDFGLEFEVESYLKHQGEKFTQRFDANSLLYLTRAIDYYELVSLEKAEADFLFVSYTSDWIYPSHQSVRLNEMALQAGCKTRHFDIDLPFGHDSFLLDGASQAALLAEFLNN